MPDYLVPSKSCWASATVAVTLILLLGNDFSVASFQPGTCLAQAYLPPARPSPWGQEALEPQKVNVLAP